MTGLVTVGETMALLSAPGEGHLRHQRSLDLRIGGAESNAAIAVRRLGTPAAWIGRLGRDGMGDLVESTLRGEGVDVHVVRTDTPTSIMVKERRPGGATHVRYYRRGGPGSELSPRDLDEAVIAGAGILHVTGITPALSASAAETVFAAIEIARGAGVDVSFDVNWRPTLWAATDATPVLHEIASRADVVFVGDDEVELLAPRADNELAQAHALARLGVREVVVKRGARGAVALLDDVLVEQDAFPVRVVDPVGAGDAFAGAYLAELLAGSPVEQRLRTAAACGALATTIVGDWEAAPTVDDLATFLGGPGVRR
ncbi:sugar kinase [Microbacterium insulae]|uniref:Sugar kinase n=1 Tax=Microbacterium insulae TaxID=483014 RepID=A0ABW3AIB8_9MICO